MKETGSLPAPAPSRKRRWDKQSSEDNQSSKKSAWDQETTPSQSRWDETPGQLKGSETPGATPSSRMWEATPSYTPAAGSTTPGMIINDITCSNISETREAMPTKIGLHAFNNISYLHESILIFDPPPPPWKAMVGVKNQKVDVKNLEIYIKIEKKICIFLV